LLVAVPTTPPSELLFSPRYPLVDPAAWSPYGFDEDNLELIILAPVACAELYAY